MEFLNPPTRDVRAGLSSPRDDVARRSTSSRMTTRHHAMLARNLLYTGVTRGKRPVVPVGQRRAPAIAVKNRNTRRRWSKLREWMVT